MDIAAETVQVQKPSRMDNDDIETSMRTMAQDRYTLTLLCLRVFIELFMFDRLFASVLDLHAF